ncbi:hypothetical protein [Flavobacterium sp. DG2-3]|uniref:hypothetical protein n=1 Tax=Flavobacterium sp. DG2-3 TaxID=3068317 RepID=UPI002740161B|nr:hypothetical protein [Flavobacterium sp. DG2-3]MDP5200336.1 hypothetical protein [Flavobacterium sp. DG2-3]
MNLDERENYRQDDAYFQDDETGYENDRQYDDIDAPGAVHSISDNAEQDYGNDFAAEEINGQSLNPDGDKFDQEDDDELDDDDVELDEEDDVELDEEDETDTNPNRNL